MHAFVILAVLALGLALSAGVIKAKRSYQNSRNRANASLMSYRPSSRTR